jgi:uncharacterized protein YndB with AHSA1/START domain
MKFSSREDIDAPIETVFTAVTDFESFERQMLRRGIDVARDETCPPPNPGARWEAAFDWRHRRQDVKAVLVSVEAGTGYSIESQSGGITALAVVDLVALSKSRTRLFVSLDLKPSNLQSRLFIQTLKLTKSALTRRFKARVAEFAGTIPTGT